MANKRTTSKPLSLKPLKFEEAVSDLLKVTPPKKSAQEKPKQKRKQG